MAEETTPQGHRGPVPQVVVEALFESDDECLQWSESTIWTPAVPSELPSEARSSSGDIVPLLTRRGGTDSGSSVMYGIDDLLSSRKLRSFKWQLGQV